MVVEADAFKESDVIYKALNNRGHYDDMLLTAEYVCFSVITFMWYDYCKACSKLVKSEQVHKSSTDAASSVLVTALNQGRDVIMDGTLSWEPFFEQTIAMARNVHKYKYRMGVGYRPAEDGTITENYWEQVNEAEEHHTRKPYRIELVGVLCDGYHAVIRGIRYDSIIIVYFSSVIFGLINYAL